LEIALQPLVLRRCVLLGLLQLVQA